MSIFQQYLSIWVLLCMVTGLLIGEFVPIIPRILSKFEIAGISIPIAILIWAMIYPMMLKVDFESIKQIGRNPRGLMLTWIVNWLIKPFTMYVISYLFFFVIFATFIDDSLATEYLAGAVLLGAAPCTAMVFVWSSKFDNIITIGLMLTLMIIFSSQSQVILEDPLHILLIAIPLTIQTIFIFAIAFFAARIIRLPFDIAAPAGMIGASNFFELAVAVAIALFGTSSPAALATTVGVLTEVPIMLMLVRFANNRRHFFN